jgi:kinesin family protein 18/19
LRELNPSSATNRRSITPTAASKPVPVIHVDGAGGGSSTSGSDTENHDHPGKEDAMKIREAVRRSSSVRRSGVNGSRTQRRRSPTAATTAAGSPPNDTMFGPGHIRRMVTGKSEKENEWKVGVLSPRVQGVMSHARTMSGSRRTTLNGMDVRTTPTVADRPVMRMSSVLPGHGSSHSVSRGSLMPNGKTVWR